MTLSSSGLSTKTFEDILAEMSAEVLASPTLNPDGRSNLGPDSAIGVLLNIVADKIAEREQLTQAVYASQYLTAEGASLDAFVALRGLTRLAASASLATLTLTGTDGTLIAAGKQVRDPLRPSVLWTTLTSVTIASGTATVVAQASVTGPISASTGTLTQIVTPVAGWSTVTNLVDASLGRDVEVDADLRRRFIEQLSSPGLTQAAAIRAQVLAIAGVTECYVYENTLPSGSINGLPTRSIEVIVAGGADNDIALAIHRKKSAGIYSYSATGDSGFVTGFDAVMLDNAEEIAFSRPQDVNAFIYVEIVKSSSNLSDATIKTALAQFGNTFTIGQTVIRSRFIGAAYAVPGVGNVRRLAISRVAQPTEASPDSAFVADIALAFRERAVFDTSRIVVAFV